MPPVIEAIGNIVGLGEGPIWDPESQSLYFVDIPESSVHRYDSKTKKHFSAKIDAAYITIIIKVEGQKNKFLISDRNDIYLITWDGVSDKIESKELWLNVDDNATGKKFNDGKVDSKGRLWIGQLSPQKASEETSWVFDPEKGSLFLINKDKTFTAQLEKITLANGLAWSLDDKHFYYIDSHKNRVEDYDYDAETGRLSNEKTVFDLKEQNLEGFADGMTIDLDGNLWVAIFRGSSVIKIDPRNGKLLYTLQLPVTQVTSVCFGGPNYDELYVTSGKMMLTEEQIAQYPLSGTCFRVTNLGVKGVPSLPVRL